MFVMVRYDDKFSIYSDGMPWLLCEAGNVDPTPIRSAARLLRRKARFSTGGAPLRLYARSVPYALLRFSSRATARFLRGAAAGSARATQEEQGPRRGRGAQEAQLLHLPHQSGTQRT